MGFPKTMEVGADLTRLAEINGDLTRLAEIGADLHPSAHSVVLEGGFAVLANPWCRGDSCWVAEAPWLPEYVQNPETVLYRGAAEWPEPRLWDLGLYANGVLDWALYMVHKWVPAGDRADMPRLTRRVAGKLYADEQVEEELQEGIISCRWNRDYVNGTSPKCWLGSTALIRQHMAQLGEAAPPLKTSRSRTWEEERKQLEVPGTADGGPVPLLRRPGLWDARPASTRVFCHYPSHILVCMENPYRFKKYQ